MSRGLIVNPNKFNKTRVCSSKTVNAISTSYFSLSSQGLSVTISLMAHTHCTGPGPGQGPRPGTTGIYSMHLLYTLHGDRDREWDWGLIVSVPIFPVPVPVTVIVPVLCSVY